MLWTGAPLRPAEALLVCGARRAAHCSGGAHQQHSMCPLMARPLGSAMLCYAVLCYDVLCYGVLGAHQMRFRHGASAAERRRPVTLVAIDAAAPPGAAQATPTPCHAVACCVMLCHAVSCYAMLWGSLVPVSIEASPAAARSSPARPWRAS